MGINEALGSAYHATVDQGRPAALEILRAAVSEDRPSAEAKLAELATVVRARTRGDRCGAHIEKMQHDILAEALGGAD